MITEGGRENAVPCSPWLAFPSKEIGDASDLSSVHRDIQRKCSDHLPGGTFVINAGDSIAVLNKHAHFSFSATAERQKEN